MATRSLLVLACALGVLSSSEALAHDYWIRPGVFQLESPGAVDLRLFVGTRGDVVEHPYRRSATVRFHSHGPKGVAQVLSTAQRRPAGRAVTRAQGVQTVVFQSRHSYI
ncbi:MAG: hypothetical protein KJO07_02615, partial [Deltaproteobacteria bacterium]|nr:hypothetical protein [Deltaproteobacteria bacterium]